MMARMLLLLWSSSRSSLSSVHAFVPTGVSQQLSRLGRTENVNSLVRTFATIDNSTATSTEESPEEIALMRAKRKEAKLQKKAAAKAKRSKFIGMAKAVDRGQFKTTYQPGGSSGFSFVAKSGLPEDHSTRPFTVLGIESSCDDTGAAIVRSDGVILGEALASQSHIHEEWGGIVPSLAKSAHEDAIDKVIDDALQKAQLKIEEIDAIGVTVGPGLELCLRVGSEKACQLANEYSKPFVGVHHLEAHILMARIEDEKALEFPFLALLVSGGHCQLLKCLGIGRYSVIGGTLDDSLGECYDKTARLLGLPIGGGGGPALEALAKEGNATAIPLTIPLQKRQDCDFSYAGLKTNIRRAAEKLTVERGLETVLELSREDKADLAASFQNVAIKHLEQRLIRAMKLMQDENINTLAVVGGVAANQELRRRLQTMCDDKDWSMVVPPPRLCTDQGAMASWAAVERLRLGSSDDPSKQDIFARYPFASYDESSETK
mmetsp:Transcript_3677/g.8766  ORF Transcript_3677/g.8766 Transcript_3677/m.8766 type:complete len:490 (+) Transcript_3677:189-1658(+)